MVEYTMPVLYPDPALVPVLYIKRISTNFFFDNALIDTEHVSQYYNFIGMDLNFTINLCTILIPFGLGVRYSYTLQDREHYFNFLLFGVGF